METLMRAVREQTVREPVQLTDLLNLLGRGDETTERLSRVEAQLHQAASRLNKLRSVHQEFDDYATPDGRSVAEGKGMEMQSLAPASSAALSSSTSTTQECWHRQVVR
jgi:hypothetical protein